MINRPAGLDVPEMDIDPFSHDFLTMPYPDHERMREAGPWVWLTQHGILATCRHAQVKAVLSDHANFISSAGVGLANFNREAPFRPKSLILEADPPDHTRARTILARILSPKTVTHIRESFKQEADQLVDTLLQRCPRGPPHRAPISRPAGQSAVRHRFFARPTPPPPIDLGPVVQTPASTLGK